MAIREFTDSMGVTWRVWRTKPRAGSVYGETLRGGWLTFESSEGRRRLAPVPTDWVDATPQRLDLMCRAAEAVRRPGQPPGRAELSGGS